MSHYQHRTHRLALRLGVLIMFMGLSGCLSPIALDHATIAYNQASADILTKQLLLNIARARHNDPFSFTGISNIAATFNFQATAGMAAAATGDIGSLITPQLGVSASDNPTISIVPIEGEEFTKRLLRPLQENQMTLLLRQNIDVDLLLRLVAQEFRSYENGREVVYQNHPADPSYDKFRRVALHLSSIQDRHHLHAEPLFFKRSWTVPVSEFTAEGFQALKAAEYSVVLDAKKHEYRLSKLITGEILITNYDPMILNDEERKELNDLNEIFAPNELFIDIRPEYPGGEFPMQGKFRLRSFGNILAFIGESIADAPERPIERDPRTPPVTENPAFTLQIDESRNTLFNLEDGIVYKGRYYSIKPEQGYQWNKKAFVLLAQIFQMTISEVPRVGVPSITIAK